MTGLYQYLVLKAFKRYVGVLFTALLVIQREHGLYVHSNSVVTKRQSLSSVVLV